MCVWRPNTLCHFFTNKMYLIPITILPHVVNLVVTSSRIVSHQILFFCYLVYLNSNVNISMNIDIKWMIYKFPGQRVNLSAKQKIHKKLSFWKEMKPQLNLSFLFFYQTECERMCSHLVEIDSQDENDFLTKTIINKGTRIFSSSDLMISNTVESL